ncbi:hypothetical protein ALO69_101320 [Pseudomonas ficuserectae]|nr:hypothetical protein ALO69_101320 [Pseudomonas ficuserectae]RMS35350.1 hypothetical protein ALP67_101049 [Pseudomonas ficuserectae]
MTCNATLPAIWLTTFIARSIVGLVESLSATRAKEDAMLVRLIICFPGNSLSSWWQATGSGSTGCPTLHRRRTLTRASVRCVHYGQPALAAIAVTSTRIPSTASDATPTAARTGHGFLKKRLYTSLKAARSAMSVR